MNQVLTPPELLEPPAPVGPVEESQARQMVKLDPEKIPELDTKVDAFIQQVNTADLQSDEFQARVNAIHKLGTEEIRASANVSSRILERPTKAMDSGLLGDDSPVATALVDLRNTLEDLDPSRQGDLLSPRKLLGFIPWGNRLRNYFVRYQSSQTQINKVLESLYHGQDELRKDNAAIEQEKVNLWNIMQLLQQYIYVGKKIDEAIDARVADIELRDQEKARVIKEEILFYVRQKVVDLLTQLAVSVQGYLALDMVRKNNLELIKGVERATTTTISALRTAVMIANALVNQKLVLDQITALNRTTGNLIESSAEMLKRQSGQIHEQAASATVEVEKLQRAFGNIYATLDMISEYKVQALGSMQQTVSTLSKEVDKANEYLDGVRQEEASRSTSDVRIDESSQPEGVRL